MNSARRAYFYLREKRKQTALLFFFFLLFMGLILGCLYYESRVELEKKKLAQKVGATLVVGRERDIHKLVTDRQDMITEGQIHHLSLGEEHVHDSFEDSKIECIERSGQVRVIGEDIRAYWGSWKDFTVEDAKEFNYTQEDVGEMKPEYLHIKAMTHPENEIGFREKEEVLLEGRFPKEGETNYAIISKKVAEESGKKLGDAITIKWDNQNKATLDIIGIQSQNTEDVFPMWADPVNRIYTDIATLETLTGEKAYNEVRFVLKDAQDMENFKKRAKTVFSEEKYLLMEDAAVYARGVQSIESSGQTARIAKWVLLAAEMVVFLLLTLWQLGGRYREMGILLAMGEKKTGVLFQLFLEMFFPMAAAFVIVMVVGLIIAGVEVSVLLFSSNVLVFLAATAIPSLYILAKHPSELLIHR